MKQIKVSSAIVCLTDFDVVREKFPHFLCCKKDKIDCEISPADRAVFS